MQISRSKSKATIKLPVFKVQGDRTPVPDGEYNARITNIECDKYKNVRDCIKFTFEIVDGDFVGRQLTGWANSPKDGKATMNTKLVRWYQAAIGHQMGDDDVLKLDEIIDHIVVVRTQTNTTKFDNQFSNVVDIVRLVTEL